MSLHGNPIVASANLPDGRNARIRVGIAQDSYIPNSESNTVVLEVHLGNAVAAVIDTIIDPAQVDAARHLATRVGAGLSSRELKPPTSSLERLADTIL